jgi:hypothetical protein
LFEVDGQRRPGRLPMRIRGSLREVSPDRFRARITVGNRIRQASAISKLAEYTGFFEELLRFLRGQPENLQPLDEIIA